MLTNNQIVEIVYRQYGIKSLINRMIMFSDVDGSGDDLEQYIYEQLLNLDNNKLNQLYIDKKLRNFCALIIKNQRSGGPKLQYHYKPINTEYHKHFKFYGDWSMDSRSEYAYNEDEYDDEIDKQREFGLNKINEYLELWNLSGITKEQKKLAFGARLIVLYIDRNWKLQDLAKRYGLCRQYIYHIMATLKKKIRDEYNDTHTT